MFKKFRATGGISYIDTLLEKLDLEVEIKQDAKNDCIYPSVKGSHTYHVDNAVSCWLQLKLKEAGFSVESVRTHELITSSWGHNQDEMLFSSDPELEEPLNVADAEYKIAEAIKKDDEKRREYESERERWAREAEEKKQKEEALKLVNLEKQRELYKSALSSVKYRRTEKLDIDENWYIYNFAYATEKKAGQDLFAPEIKGRFEKFTTGKYILCQDKKNEDIFFIKVKEGIYIFGRVYANSYWRSSFIISREKIFEHSSKLGDNELGNSEVRPILERCQSIKEYDTLGLVMNAGSYDGIFSGIFWGVRLNLHGDLENQWSKLNYNR